MSTAMMIIVITAVVFAVSACAAFIAIIGIDILSRHLLYKKMMKVIVEHRHRLTGQNRFIVNYNVMKSLFPKYDDFDIYMILDRLAANKEIVRDPLDGEWIINSRGDDNE